ncbi:MAG: thioredoxin family protein, partial [Thermaurantiacus sp.]
GLWWLGLRQGRGQRALAPAAVALVAALAAPAALARLPAVGSETAVAANPAFTRTVSFTPSALADLTASRTPVFLYFTADWCVTCKVNERGALASAEVATAFDTAGITVMVADWTRPDPAIARFLADRQRAGIPLYLFYSSDGGVEELPQILTVGRLRQVAEAEQARGVQLATLGRTRSGT